MDDKLTISLPTGRLKKDSLALLSQLPDWPSGFEFESRKLVFEEATSPYRIVFSHPKDSSTYVEFGAADLGIVGKDILLERGNEVYELLDLKIGSCTMVLAGPQGVTRSQLWEKEELRIATKYPNFTRKYLQERGITADIIPLYGSIEVAPTIGLSDAIVDLVSTGTTLKENQLWVIEEIVPISARVVANRVSIKIKAQLIQQFIKKLEKVVKHE
ncbi:MAG: phosphoribosyltransferase [Candidatus Atribacteria bacterium]|nr:phosphoribosyltransferase [Candidatus Atribacteria bacterium]